MTTARSYSIIRDMGSPQRPSRFAASLSVGTGWRLRSVLPLVSRRSSARFLRAVGDSAGRGFVVALALLGLGATAASAHGPCRCLPPEVRPGDAMVINNVFRVVLNPTRRDIYYEQPALIAAHVDGTPREVLVDRDRGDARKRARLVVPNVPAGRYLVLMYDGSEGGAH